MRYRHGAGLSIARGGAPRVTRLDCLLASSFYVPGFAGNPVSMARLQGAHMRKWQASPGGKLGRLRPERPPRHRGMGSSTASLFSKAVFTSLAIVAGPCRSCAAAHESGSGTIRTSSDVRLESAFRGKADSMCSARVFRLLTRSRRSVLVQNLRAARTIKPNPTTAKPIVTATLTQKTPGFWVRLKRGPPRQVRLSWRHLCWRSRRAS
jgi:hypothetical protein